MPKKRQAPPLDPLLQSLQAIDPPDLDASETLLREQNVPLLRKQVTPDQKTAEEAVLALSKKQRGVRRWFSVGALLLVAGVYIIDFIRNPAYTMALVLAILAAALGIFVLGSEKREAPKTAALYCQNVPSFDLCLFAQGIVFADGEGNIAVCPAGSLTWCETEHLFACLVNGRGLIYLPKEMLSEEETALVKGLFKEN